MRELLRLCPVALLIAGCGFDTTTSAIPGGGGGASGSAGAGTAAVAGNLNDMTMGGTAAGTGPMAGTGGVITPMGGNGGGGVAGSAGSPMGGAGMAGGGAAGMGGMGGAAGMGGAGGSGGASNINPHFKLAWRDDFDSFDDGRWTKQSHTFDENLSRFSPNNAVVEGGLLKLKVTHQQNQDKPYTAAELASKQLFTFGRFAGRIKFCPGSGMVSSLFTYHDDVNTSWQEIDIEHLGNLPKSVQYNLISGNLANRIYQPKVVTFAFSPPADFHEYVIEWRPENITFFVDGTQTHQAVQAAIKDSARLHMNAWPTDNAHTSFAGTFDPNAVPCEADYDWIEAYTYTP